MLPGLGLYYTDYTDPAQCLIASGCDLKNMIRPRWASVDITKPKKCTGHVVIRKACLLVSIEQQNKLSLLLPPPTLYFWCSCDTAPPQEFLLVRFLEPLLVLAKEAEKGRFVLLSEDEDEVIWVLSTASYALDLTRKIAHMHTMGLGPSCTQCSSSLESE